jgi:hypothetical protein
MKDWANSSRRAMVAAAWRLVVLLFVGLPATVGAQTALKFFTNQANALLQAQFGFGVTNIPLYSTTNASNGYTAAIHYVLQAAANDYDATNLSSVFPSVFRPQFAWQSNGLWIVGYTNVVGDFDAQLARGFKQLNDPTIGLNDNVWGVPWVVGAKNNPPNFNEYSYATVFNIARRIVVTRPSTNIPPTFVNQFYEMSLSNIFGAEAWNSYSNVFTNPVSIIVTNLVSILFTNNYNWGTNFSFMTGTNWPISSWAGWNSGNYSSTDSFLVPLLTTVVPLPDSEWSETLGQFVPGSNYLSLPTNDDRQVAWPVHDWMVQVTNQLMYALVDTGTGTNRVLDFVNLGGFGSGLDINQALNQFETFPPQLSYLEFVWQTNGATDDSLTSPMSSGTRAQIEIAEGMMAVGDWPPPHPPAREPSDYYMDAIAEFHAVMQGGGTGLTVLAPFVAKTTLWQSCSWQAVTPWVHYTIEDLTNPGFDEFTALLTLPVPFAFFTTNLGNIGRINPIEMYPPTRPPALKIGLTGGDYWLAFAGFKNLPFAVWDSSDLLNWGFLGTALQPSPGQFQFSDPASTNDTGRFYQLRLP